jgi:hypothetical protein
MPIARHSALGAAALLPVGGGGGYIVVKIRLHGGPRAGFCLAQSGRPRQQRRVQRGAKPLRRERAVQPLGIKKQVVFIPEKACGQNPPLRLCFLQRGGKVGKSGILNLPAQNGMKGAAADGGIGQRCRQRTGHNIPLLYLVIILYCTMPGQQKICGIVQYPL